MQRQPRIRLFTGLNSLFVDSSCCIPWPIIKNYNHIFLKLLLDDQWGMQFLLLPASKLVLVERFQKTHMECRMHLQLVQKLLLLSTCQTLNTSKGPPYFGISLRCLALRCQFHHHFVTHLELNISSLSVSILFHLVLGNVEGFSSLIN